MIPSKIVKFIREHVYVDTSFRVNCDTLFHMFWSQAFISYIDISKLPWKIYEPTFLFKTVFTLLLIFNGVKTIYKLTIIRRYYLTPFFERHYTF